MREIDDVSFGTIEDGEFVPVGEVNGEVALSVEHEEVWADQPYLRQLYRSFVADLVVEDYERLADAIAKLNAGFPHATEREIRGLALRVERVVGSKYRHKYVWQYRQERKGCRKGRKGCRKGRARRRSLRLTTTYHNVTATCDGDTLTFNANA